MAESCSLLMDELDEVEEDIKKTIDRIIQGEKELIEQDKELHEKREKIVKRINACQKDWDWV